jgi:hypothetical protein
VTTDFARAALLDDRPAGEPRLSDRTGADRAGSPTRRRSCVVSATPADRLPDEPRNTDVNRRALLAALAAGTAGLAAGCGGVVDRTDGETGRPETTRTPADRGSDGPASASTTADAPTLAELGSPATICESEPIPGFHVRAIVEPAFADDWSSIDPDPKYRLGDDRATATDGERTAPGERTATDGERSASESDSRRGLSPGATVIGLVAGDRARAYPLPVVWWHEAVNDAFGGPVLVTYCPICRSGVVAERRVAGEPTVFDVSGQLWQPPGEYAAASEADGAVFGASVDDPAAGVRNSGNLVLVDDATGSFWSQLLARAICGPRRGDRLRLRPATVTTWSAWRRDHPDTDVLLPPPHSGVRR